MEGLKFGDIVLIKFPYTDGKRTKKRPALVINDFSDGDIIVCRITSRIYESKNDIFLGEWKKTGLKLPSVVRIHKLATLKRDMVSIKLGEIGKINKVLVRKVISELME